MRTTLVLILCTFTAFGSNYILYHRTSSPVTNQVVQYSPLVQPALPSGNHALLTYSLKPPASNWNGVLPALATNLATIRWCKVSNNLVVPMTAAESNSIVTFQANADAVASSNALALAQIQAKAGATGALVNYFSTPEGRLQFAFMEATMDALNAIRGGLAGNTNMPLLTLTQLTNAVKVRIAAQANSAP